MAEIGNYQAAVELSPARERRNYAEQSNNSRNPSNNKLTVNLGTNPFMDTIEEHNNDSVNEFEGWFLRPEEQSPLVGSRVNSREFIRLSPLRLRLQQSGEKQSQSKLSAPFTRKNLKKLLNQKEKPTVETNGISSLDSDFTLHDSITDENPNVETKVMELNTNHSVSKLDSFKKNKTQTQSYQQQILLSATQNIQFEKNPSLNSQNNAFCKSTLIMYQPQQLQPQQQQQPFLSEQSSGAAQLLPFPFSDLKNQNNRLHTEAFQKPADSSASKTAATSTSSNQPQQIPLYLTSPCNESSSLHSTQLDDPINNNPQLQNNSSFFHFSQKPIQIQKQLHEFSDFANSQQPLEILTNQSIQIPDNSPQIIPLFLRINEQSTAAAAVAGNMRNFKEPMRSQSTCVRSSVNSNPARALKDLRIYQQQQQTFVHQNTNSRISIPDQQQQQAQQSKQTLNKPTEIAVKSQHENENQSLQIAPPQFYLNSTNLMKPKSNNSLHLRTGSMQSPASFQQNSVQVDLSQYLLKNPVNSPSINQAKARVTNSLHVESIRGITQQNNIHYQINTNKPVEQTLNLDYASSSSRIPVITPNQTQPLYTSSFTRNQNQFQSSLISSQNLIQSHNLLDYSSMQQAQPLQQQQQLNQLLQQSLAQAQSNNSTGNNNSNNLKKWQINKNINRDSTNHPPSSSTNGEHQQMQAPFQHQSQSELPADISHIDLESFSQSRLGMKIAEDQEKQFQLADSPLKSARIYSPEASPQINITNTPSSWHGSMHTSKQPPPVNYNFNYKIQETPSTAASFTAATADKQTATFKEFTKASSQGKPFYPLALYSSKNPTSDTPFYIQKVDDVLKQIKVNKPQSDMNLAKKAPIIPVKLLHSPGIPQGSLTSKYIK